MRESKPRGNAGGRVTPRVQVRVLPGEPNGRRAVGGDVGGPSCLRSSRRARGARLRRMSMLDLLIRGGLVIDGTGNPGFYGAVAVEGERVRVLRGSVAGLEAAPVVDATRPVVCPAV